MADDVLTRNDEGELAVRVVSATEQQTVVNPNDVYTRDADGNLAIRTVGNGGGGGSDPHNLGWYATPEALRTAHPTADDGDWAIVGSTDTVWVWDSDTNAWKDSDQKGQVTSVNGQTGAVTVQETLVSGTNIKTINGTSLLSSGDITTEEIQISTMPTASADELGNIYQFVGTTDANYTNGYFYKCVSDGALTPTYSWSRIDVQPTPTAPVTSVNGYTGAVVLTASTIGATSMTVPSTMPTLAVADWSSNTQTVSVAGVTTTNTVIVSPAPASADDYASAGIVCTAQGTGTLTFTCDTVPSNAITVNVVIFN